MKSWFGFFYLSPGADPLEVTVLATEEAITIGYRQEDGRVETKKWATEELDVFFDSSVQSSRINFAKEPGSKLLIPGKDPIDFMQAIKDENRKPWHRKQKNRDRIRILGVFFSIMIVLVTAYFLVVPWFSEKMAMTVEPATEAQFGAAVYSALALSDQEEKSASAHVNDFFREMKIVSSYRIHITVVNGDMVNAFALPGGNIVVYTGLLQQLKTYPELAALLSHEYTHINNRHSTKAIFRQLGSRIFLALILGNFGSVTSVLIDHAERFKSLRYSRDLEKEADLEGLEILKERRIDARGFEDMLMRLKNATGVSALPEFLESHPDIDKRINYIREASVSSGVDEHPQLESIFEKIKQVK